MKSALEGCTSIYIKTRQYGGTYIARVTKPKLKLQASCTAGAEQAANVCAIKALSAGWAYVKLHHCGEGIYRADYKPAEKAA